jgi:hypothetical protein
LTSSQLTTLEDNLHVIIQWDDYTKGRYYCTVIVQLKDHIMQ